MDFASPFDLAVPDARCQMLPDVVATPDEGFVLGRQITDLIGVR